MEKLNINEHRDNYKFIFWFKKLDNKSKNKQLDIKEFYPSTIQQLKKCEIKQSNQTQLKVVAIHLEKARKKNESSSCFDVTMGSYDGAEICELIGIFTQSVLQDIINKKQMGLLRDDELIVLSKATSQKKDNIRKKIFGRFI